MSHFQSWPQHSSKRISHMSNWSYPVMALATLPSMSQPCPYKITLIRWTGPTKENFIPVCMDQLKETYGLVWLTDSQSFSFTTVNPFLTPLTHFLSHSRLVLDFFCHSLSFYMCNPDFLGGLANREGCESVCSESRILTNVMVGSWADTCWHSSDPSLQQVLPNVVV